MLTRRKLVAIPVLAAMRRTVSMAPIGAMFLPFSARAEPVTIAIAIAAAVAGMIAANNRGSGIGAFLEAINKKLDIAIDQLASLQDSIALALEELARLPSEIDRSLREDDVRKLHDAIYAAVISYMTKIAPVRKNYASDEDYRRQPGAMLDIQAALNDLEAATARLQSKAAYGPTTGMVIPAAFLLENSLLLLRGDRPSDISVRLRSSINWLDHVTDPLVSTSAVYYRAQAVLRHQQYFDAASKTLFGKALSMKPGSVLFECVGVNDFRSPETYTACSGGGDGGASVTGSSCTVFVDPGRDGPWERLYADVLLEEKPYVAKVVIKGKESDVPAGFNALYVTRKDSAILPADNLLVPKVCSISLADVETPAARATWLRNRLAHSPRNADLTILQTLVDNMNLERARMSLATASLTIVAHARTELSRIISDLDG